MGTPEKKTIVIASVLKPVDDIRMAEKIGVSLSRLPGIEVHVVGFPSRGHAIAGLAGHALPFFGRISLARAIAGVTVFRRALSLRPVLFIAATHELLWVALALKLVTGCKVIYDVQENYFRNIRFTRTFPVIIRQLLSAYVRASEYVFSPAIDHFFLAEQSYAQEFSFHRGRFTVLENKAKKVLPDGRPARDPKKLLFSGTLAESTGVFKAIELAAALHGADGGISLTLIGHCPQKSTLEKIRRMISSDPYISLIGGDQPVPHDDITKEILTSGAGIVSYPYNPSTHHSIPTKLYEYLAYRLPVLMPYHRAWSGLCAQYDAAIDFEWDNPDPRKILDALVNKGFYTKAPEDVFWDSEEKKLITTVRRILPT